MKLIILIYLSLSSLMAFSQDKIEENSKSDTSITQESISQEELQNQCVLQLKNFPGKSDQALLRSACAKVQTFEGCRSVDGEEIFYYDKTSEKKNAKKVLVFSLIHGDETNAGTVGRFWMERLEAIDPRNSWRVVPILNPDGVKLKTRTNANKIDLNRNFPTSDWGENAIKYWKSKASSSPRRFPGAEPASEPEVKCALKHIEDYKPDFVISVHTPLTVLDFDGPKIKPPVFDYLPWKSLGTFPGSLGRYMWYERKTPVLTMELKTNLPRDNQPFEKLQDVIGTLVRLESN